MNAIFKTKSMRLLSALLAVIMVAAMLPTAAFAWSVDEGTKCTSTYGDLYLGSDGNYYYSKAGNTLFYNDDGSFYVSYHGGGNARYKYMMIKSDGTQHQVYCIESGVSYDYSDTYNSTSGTNSKYFQNLPMTAQYGIMMALMYGYHEGMTTPVSGTNNDDFAYATQCIIWEYQQQIRTSPTSRASANGVDADLFYSTLKNRPAEKCYNWILDQMSKHYVVPSFSSRSQSSAQTYTLKYDAAKNNYSITLTDTNNTLADINFSGSGITVSRSGNQYTFTSKDMISDAVLISAQKKTNLNMGKMLIWGCPGKQTMASGAEDPVYFYFKLNTETYGVGHIVKTSEDGKVEGIKFTISGNGVNQTVTTGKNGTVDLDLLPGTYTVTELTEDKYEPQTAQTVTIVSGKTSTVTFNNKLRRGDLSVTKTSEDGLVEGVKFHLYGTSFSGLRVDEYAVTNSKGVATFKDVLIGTGYTLEEVDTAIRYVVPENQTATIEWNKVTNKTVENVLKKFNVTVKKADAETGTAQGDASLAGATYGIYKDDELIDTYTTDASGSFTTSYYVCGDDWTIREISASEGYLVDGTVYPVGAEPKLYTIEYNAAPEIKSLETVQKGKFALIKHTDDGSTQLETPEVGAEFVVYLKSAGSYDAAKKTERDYLVCDENGFAETKWLPYGIYKVHQVKGWDGRETLPDFDVYIAKDGQTYRYLANNTNFESYIKVVKVDAETGKAIPYAGAGFQLYRPDGSLITQTFTYPTPTTIDTFYTNDEGYLITPESLEYGTGYSLIEVSAPYGYVLNTDPVYFDVTADNATEENAVTIVKVVKENMPQKGVIKISKTGEVFSSVVESDGVYQPVYSVSGLAGAVYEVIADEDIYTLDGTLRYSKGDVIVTITTGEDGTAKTDPLYLGRFSVYECKAPYGMMLNAEPISVELTYAGQEIEITATSASFYNERQRVQLDLTKIMEQDEKFGIGQNSEITAVQFGLYAAEDLTAADGTVIPANGLIEIVNCDENGYASFVTDIPVGAKLYVKELATDSHYILSDAKYPVVFEYAGQNVATVNITVNDGNAIDNEIIYGTIKGLKIDRETEETIAGAVFGLFHGDETEFTEDKAILIAESNEDGVFTFENVPYGNWIVVELKPAEGFLPNSDIHHVQVNEDAEIIEITVVNDRIPEIGTTATVDGEKEVNATEVFTLEDVVAYEHLIPGKEYVLKGVLMDKSTGEPLLIGGEEVHSEVIFVPETPSDEVVVTFTFDSKYIKADTDIVVFESLYKDGLELTVHADIEDEGQTVTVHVPEIGTQATANGKKEVPAEGKITIEDTVSYKNLTPGKEYTISGVLMNKATGKPFTVNGEEIRSEVTFTPETADGKVVVSFTFDASGITLETEIVVFESLYREGVEIAVHADIEDEVQTVKITPPTPDVPQTGDESNLGFWIGLGAFALGGLVSVAIIYFKKKKDDDGE